jgi:hypothetical protein
MTSQTWPRASQGAELTRRIIDALGDDPGVL